VSIKFIFLRDDRNMTESGSRSMPSEPVPPLLLALFLVRLADKSRIMLRWDAHEINFLITKIR
jgi:hypothetical protein